MCGGGSNSGGGGGGGGNNNSGGSNSGGSKPKPSGGHPSAGTGNSNNSGSSGHPSAGTGNSNNGGSSGHPSAGTGNSNSGSQNQKSGGGSNNSGGNNSGSSNNNSGSSNSNSGNSNSGNKSGGGGGNNNGGSNNKKPETTTPPPPKTTPPPKTETTGSENSGGSSPPPPGHPEQKAGTPGTALPGTQVPGGGLHGDGDGNSKNDSQTTQTSSNDKETKQPDKGIYGIVKFLRDVHEESYVEDSEFTKEAVTMHTLVKGGTLYIAFKGQNHLDTTSLSQSYKLLKGKKIEGYDEFLTQITTIMDKALKDGGKESKLKVNIGGFLQGGRLAMDIFQDIAKEYSDNDQVILEHVLTVDGLGLNENQIQNFNKMAEKTNVKVTSITNPNVDNDTNFSEIVYKALPLPKSENYVVYVPKGNSNDSDEQPSHNGKDILDLILRSTDDNHKKKGDFLKYVGENGSYYTHFVGDYIETEFDSPIEELLAS